jgi:myb proto-oncogene protein
MAYLDRRPWTETEDLAIRSLVETWGTRHWSKIAELLGSIHNVKNRSGKQCRERWHNHLDPSVNKDPWDSDEEGVLFNGYREFGNHWAEISRLLPGRTDNAIKNHFYSAVRRNLRKLRKTKPKLSGSLSNLLKNKEIADELTKRPSRGKTAKKPKIQIEREPCDREASSLLYHLYTSSRSGTPLAQPPPILCPSPSRHALEAATPTAEMNAMTPSAMLSTPMCKTSKFNFPDEVSAKFTWEAYELPMASEEPTTRDVRYDNYIGAQLQSPSNFLAPFSPLHCIPRNK